MVRGGVERDEKSRVDETGKTRQHTGQTVVMVRYKLDVLYTTRVLTYTVRWYDGYGCHLGSGWHPYRLDGLGAARNAPCPPDGQDTS